ncbi:hypothetical protein RCIP0089_00021 [Klebsiella phage RCIP0089]
MRYLIKQQPDGLWYVKDEDRNKVLVCDASREYCDGFLAGIAAVGGDF